MTELEKPNVPSIDSLLAASNELENKLEQAGIQDAHEWMFARLCQFPNQNSP